MILPALLLSQVSLAAVLEYSWTVDWVSSVNPDGLFERRAIGVNGVWPIPPIEATIGDKLVIHVTNKLNETTSLHFHGLFQNGTNYYDGALGITECGVPPHGGKFTYQVALDQHGSYWIHSHHAGQYPDGFRTPLVIHGKDNDAEEKKNYGYDEEYIFGLSGIAS